VEEPRIAYERPAIVEREPLAAYMMPLAQSNTDNDV